MIHYIDKPGYYRTFSGTTPVSVSDEEIKREECKHLMLNLLRASVRRETLRALLANHGAENLLMVPDSALPVLLAELRAAALVRGVK